MTFIDPWFIALVSWHNFGNWGGTVFAIVDTWAFCLIIALLLGVGGLVGFKMGRYH